MIAAKTTTTNYAEVKQGTKPTYLTQQIKMQEVKPQLNASNSYTGKKIDNHATPADQQTSKDIFDQQATFRVFFLANFLSLINSLPTLEE